MTRRIALAILFSAWAVVLVALAVVYVITRAALLAELDASIVMRASALPQLAGVSQAPRSASLPAGDRYVIRNELGQVIVRPDGQGANQGSPIVTNRKFVSVADGRRLRSLTLNFGVPAGEGQPERLATIVYSAPADAVDNLLRRLSILLAAVGAGGALLIGVVGLLVSRAALHPLRQTADVIGTINEKRLDRRLDVKALPSELRPMGERLNEMLARLEREFTLRKQFLADAAHELRTPVAAILTQLEVTLRRPREAEAMAAAMRMSLSEVQLLRRLVDSLLEQVRADHHLQREAELVDVSVLLEQCAVLAESLGAEKNVRVIRSFECDLRARLHPTAFQSIVTNLLSNAVEHSSPGGSVELACRLNDRELILSIRDQGPGIPPEVLPNIFQPFYRADSSRGADGGHLGLGLFLVQSHAQAMGGRCDVSSAVGAGSTFEVHLPLSDSGTATSAAARSEERTAAETTSPSAALAVPGGA